MKEITRFCLEARVIDAAVYAISAVGYIFRYLLVFVI